MLRQDQENPPPPEDTPADRAARLRMVERQIRSRGIADQAVLQAMIDVPRHSFLPASKRTQAYDDCPLPIGDDQTISQPYVVAYMLDALNISVGQRVLDVGSGSGYQSALLAVMGAEVFAIERVPALAETASRVLRELGIDRIRTLVGDGSSGWPEDAPYDRIICGAAAPNISGPWIEQLADGGRIVAPVGGPDVQTITVLDKTATDVSRRRLLDVRFVPLLGRYGQDTH